MKYVSDLTFTLVILAIIVVAAWSNDRNASRAHELALRTASCQTDTLTNPK